MISTYQTTDNRITIGLPILQDNGELEYPGYIDGDLIGFYPTYHTADLALYNIIEAGVLVMPDVEYAPIGW